MTAKNELISMQHFIGGEWTDAENAAVFDDFNPLDDSSTGEPPREPVRICRALRLRALSGVQSQPPARTGTLAPRVAELMEERQKELVDCLIDEIGSPAEGHV